MLTASGLIHRVTPLWRGVSHHTACTMRRLHLLRMMKASMTKKTLLASSNCRFATFYNPSLYNHVKTELPFCISCVVSISLAGCLCSTDFLHTLTTCSVAIQLQVVLGCKSACQAEAVTNASKATAVRSTRDISFDHLLTNLLCLVSLAASAWMAVVHASA